MKEHGGQGRVRTVVRKDGTIVVPAAEVKRRGLTPGHAVSVGIVPAELDIVLRRHGVSEEEAERIGVVQMEPPENVRIFLAAEGSLIANRRLRTGVRRLRR